MHPQLQAVTDEFTAAQIRLHRLADSVPQQYWTRRADPRRWSMAECVAHLNLTGQAFLPRLSAVLKGGHRPDRSAPRRYRRDVVGWILWRSVGPPVRRRIRTAAAFVPAAVAPLPVLLAEFDRLQTDQLACVAAADGVDLGKLWITSPFNPRIRYNLYSCLTILPRHQHRHLWQAEQVWRALQRRR